MKLMKKKNRNWCAQDCQISAKSLIIKLTGHCATLAQTRDFFRFVFSIYQRSAKVANHQNKYTESKKGDNPKIGLGENIKRWREKETVALSLN